MVAGATDIDLDVIYYDFSISHVDFDNIGYVLVSNPTYVASPYGAWLSMSSTPTTDTFSQWYRYNSGINYKITDDIVLEYTGSVNR